MTQGKATHSPINLKKWAIEAAIAAYSDDETGMCALPPDQVVEAAKVFYDYCLSGSSARVLRVVKADESTG